jgi:hypothetical protein
LEDAALNLAVFRVVVGLLFLTTREIREAAAWASLPPELSIAPRGWGWALALVPAQPSVAHIAAGVLVAGALLGAVGFLARPAFTAVALAGLYVMALPLRSGLPFHDQHLVWFAALCAASPCGDALSVDAWLRRRRGEPPPVRAAAYGVPLRIAWLLVGVIFFFPGLWKLRASGLAWITSDNLRNQLYWKWATNHVAPPFRIDHFPALLHVAAAGVVLFELSFAFVVWSRRARPFVVASALIFHLSAWLFMGIDFSALWLTYVAFVDWDALLARARRQARAASEARATLARATPALAVGAVLIAGAVEAGARGATNGWPFACYPTFQESAGTRMPALLISIVSADGREIPVALGNDDARDRAFSLGLVASADTAEAPARFAAYWRRFSSRAVGASWPANARAVRFFAGEWSTVPEEQSAPPARPRLLYELPLSTLTLPPR